MIVAERLSPLLNAPREASRLATLLANRFSPPKEVVRSCVKEGEKEDCQQSDQRAPVEITTYSLKICCPYLVNWSTRLMATM